MLVERAEHGGWELDRVRVAPDGTRRVVLRRKIIRHAADAHLTPRVGSDLVEEPVEDPRPELQRVDRHPLVDAVEERGEVEVGGQPQRREAEAAHARAC